MRRMLPLLCAAALLSGCAARSEPTIQTFFAMDTTMSVTAYADHPTDALVAAQQAVNRLDALWSRTRPDSDIARLNAAAGTGAVAVDGDTAALLTTANAVAEESGTGMQRYVCVGGLGDNAYAGLEADGPAVIEIGSPVRYAHSSREVADLGDIQRQAALVAGMAARIGASFQQGRFA